MKAIVMMMAVVLLMSAFSQAGVIHGTITKGGKTIGPNVKIEIVHNQSKKMYSAATNKFGCFRIFVAEVGKCTLTLRGKKSAPSIPVDSFKTSNKCNLVVYHDNKGQLRLRRK